MKPLTEQVQFFTGNFNTDFLEMDQSCRKKEANAQ